MKKHFAQDHEPSQQRLPAAKLFSPPSLDFPRDREHVERLVGGDKGEGATGRDFSACRTGLASARSVAGLPAVPVAGFTLIEVLVAIVILTFGLLAVGSMQISAIRGNFMGGNTSIALSLASEKMEHLLNADYNNTVPNTNLTDSNTGNNSPSLISSITSVDHEEPVSEEGTVGAGGFYRRIWNIATQTSPPSKSVMVIVTWENNRHRVSIASIKRP
jgi:prepilin-type N-terminal cleavage/methylation domain-containing protein